MQSSNYMPGDSVERLVEAVSQLTTDVRVLVSRFDDAKDVAQDHEERLRTIEQVMWRAIGIGSACGAVVAVLSVVASFLALRH